MPGTEGTAGAPRRRPARFRLLRWASPPLAGARNDWRGQMVEGALLAHGAHLPSPTLIEEDIPRRVTARRRTARPISSRPVTAGSPLRERRPRCSGPAGRNVGAPEWLRIRVSPPARGDMARSSSERVGALRSARARSDRAVRGRAGRTGLVQSRQTLDRQGRTATRASIFRHRRTGRDAGEAHGTLAACADGRFGRTHG